MKPLLLFLLLMSSVTAHPGGADDSSALPLIIAHRGASGYLPEHTLEAKALAVGMGAQALEQDVVLTRDGHFIVLHDIHLDTVTDVASVFPERARGDGRFYALDFSLEEIQSLRVTERFDRETHSAVYPERFPAGRGSFRIPSLEAELVFIQGLEASLGRPLTVYLEFKAPAWHRGEGFPMEEKLLCLLNRYGYESAEDSIFVQCFDPAGLKQLRALGCSLRLVQLLGANTWQEAPVDYHVLKSPEGLREIATYAEGIGPWIPFCYQLNEGTVVSSGLVEEARESGLFVHPFTFRTDAFPDDFESFEECVRFFVHHLKVDGLFTDQPDRVLRLLKP